MPQITRQDYINKYTKQQIEELLADNSQSKVAKIIGCGREMIKSIMDYHSIPSTYIKNTHITAEDIIQQLSNRKSMIQIAHKYGCEICTLNQKLRKLENYVKPKVQFTKEEIFESIDLCDVNNQGFTKVISVGDPNLVDSIIELTKEHKLYGDKITERLYRLAHGYTAEQHSACSICSGDLKFYTYALGYGSSDHEICRRCIPSISVPSKHASKLFDEIYNYYQNSINCFYFPHNYEYNVKVEPNDKIYFNNNVSLNSREYVLDFVCGTKVIEYDGHFRHNNREVEDIKDNFLKYKGYQILHILHNDHIKFPEETLQKCIDFLNSP